MRNSLKNITARKEQILSYINAHGRAEVETLAELFGISTVTVRRDLDALAAEDMIERSYGGASKKKEAAAAPEDALSAAPISRLEEIRRAIAREAAQLIDDDDIVFVNSSATASYVIEYIERDRVTIVTNNIKILNRKKKNPNTVLIITGGQVSEGLASLTGVVASNALTNIVANKSILGVRGITAAEGITSGVSEEAHVNRQMICQTSGKVIIVADHSKIGKKDSFFTRGISSVTDLVTDKTDKTDALAPLRQAGVTVHEVVIRS